ncbi:hypothetical protein B0J14DRAFT_53678 [Halenospora varia]|nr:hypothetical protein B0J14DRAFT_53678 [Halenospora varia]
MGLPLFTMEHPKSIPAVIRASAASSSSRNSDPSAEYNAVSNKPDVALYLDMLPLLTNDVSISSIHQNTHDGLLLDLNSLASATAALQDFTPQYPVEHGHTINPSDLSVEDRPLENEAQAAVLIQLPDCVPQDHNPSLASGHITSQQQSNTLPQRILIYGASSWCFPPSASLVPAVLDDIMSHGRNSSQLRTFSSTTPGPAPSQANGILSSSAPRITSNRHCRCAPAPLQVSSTA